MDRHDRPARVAGGARQPAAAGERTLHELYYSPSSRVGDIDSFLDRYARRSAEARSRYRHFTIQYGPRPEQLLDLFPADREERPLQVYVHGGYWQELSKDESSFAAPNFLDRGVAFVALGYGLAPAYQLDEIVAQVREGLWWLVQHAATLPGRPWPIHLSGSSAGAHLVAMALAGGWLPAGLEPADVFAGATLLSGVYELRPLLTTYINDALGLNAVAAARNSVTSRLADRLPPLIVALGENETPAFYWQHRRFVTAARSRAARMLQFTAHGRNHFDLPMDLGVPETDLGSAVLAAVLPPRER